MKVYNGEVPGKVALVTGTKMNHTLLVGPDQVEVDCRPYVLSFDTVEDAHAVNDAIALHWYVNGHPDDIEHEDPDDPTSPLVQRPFDYQPLTAHGKKAHHGHKQAGTPAKPKKG